MTGPSWVRGPDWDLVKLVALLLVALLALPACWYVQYRYDLWMAQAKGEAMGKALRGDK